LELLPWKLAFKPGWDRHFKKFDSQAKKRILKKFEQMKQPLAARGLHSSRYCVEEAGQFRIAFIRDDESGTKLVHFVGNHKQYEEWYREQ
jgi:hypothetical protein